jgi:hypothetical protein
VELIVLILAAAVLLLTALRARAAARAVEQHAAARVTAAPTDLMGPAAAAGRDLLNAVSVAFARSFAWLLVVGILVLLILGFNLIDGSLNLFLLTMLNRYGLAVGLALVGLVPLGLYTAPSLLRSLFVLRSPAQLFHVAWLTLLAGATVLAVVAVTELNAGGRYALGQVWEHEPPLLRSAVQAAALLALALPVPLACLSLSMKEGVAGLRGVWVAWLVAGLVSGLVLLALLHILHEMFLPSSVLSLRLLPFQTELHALLDRLGLPHYDSIYPAVSWLARAFSILGPGGYVDQGHLAAGHAQVMSGAFLALLIYGGYYVTVSLRKAAPDRDLWFPPIFFALLILVLIGYALQGLAFALDLFHVPVLLFVVLFVYVLYQFNRTDHYFDLMPEKPTAAPKQPAAAPRDPLAGLKRETRSWSLARAATTWKDKIPAAKGGRTLVAVTASGGGIQATAWVARVLVGLHERYGDSFTRSIRLVSAVSGGSVGAMYFLDRWQDGGAVLPADALAFGADGRPRAGSICERAMASSLEATAWGLAFPDLLRIVFPLVVSRTDDRGARIEEAWRARLSHPEARLTDWTPRVLRGDMPVPVFNATVVETGQRMLSAPVLGETTANPGPAQPRQLLELFPHARPYVSTAVRLSATFPFVSPICRPLEVDRALWRPENAYHFCDGGYIDNEGLVTVIEWLRLLLDDAYFPQDVRKQSFDRVLLARLMPFPKDVTPAPAAQNKGWFYSVAGPLEALQHVRVASQAERNDLAVALFTAAAGVPVHQAAFYYEAPTGASPPLSWMLTETQKADIERAWQRFQGKGVPENPLDVVDQFFP